MLKKSFIAFSFLFLFICLLSVNTYAAELFSLSEFNTNGLTATDVFVLESSNGDLTAFAIYETVEGKWGTSSHIHVVDNSGNVSVYFKGTNMAYKYGHFEKKSGQTEWTLLNTYNKSSYGSTSYRSAVGVPIYSTFDVVYEDGTIFFPLTPAEEETTLEKIMKTAEEMAEEILQTTKTILPYGVTCLALLIGLALLLKVFRR